LLAPKLSLPKDQRQLLNSYTALSTESQQSLLAFAEFLVSRISASESDQQTVESSKPLDIPRPGVETVVGAIKRLTATYQMMDTDPLLNDVSVLMGAHLMKGQPAGEVIDQLQVLFEESYVIFIRED